MFVLCPLLADPPPIPVLTVMGQAKQPKAQRKRKYKRTTKTTTTKENKIRLTIVKEARARWLVRPHLWEKLSLQVLQPIVPEPHQPFSDAFRRSKVQKTTSSKTPTNNENAESDTSRKELKKNNNQKTTGYLSYATREHDWFHPLAVTKTKTSTKPTNNRLTKPSYRSH